MLLIPDSYISGNYPNPFNPTTKIRIFINTSDMAKIKMLRIYNSLGQLVAVIDITNLSSGWQEIEFNGKDMFGNNLSSGVYFVQLLMDNNHMNTVRMNLVK
jgi:flagellar hook assembly protein FlgD